MEMIPTINKVEAPLFITLLVQEAYGVTAQKPDFFIPLI
jgi:hypothetical protein